MLFYQIPRLNEVVKWSPDQPASVLRFTDNGGLALLHATADPALTTKAWLTEPLELGLSRPQVVTDPVRMEVPPLLGLRLGSFPVLLAPACIFELGDLAGILDWLNARAMPPELRLVLLRLDPENPGQARVEASRRIWAPEWATGDEMLRLRLERQCLDTDQKDAGWLQYHGRLAAATQAPADTLATSPFRLFVAGEVLEAALTTASERVSAN